MLKATKCTNKSKMINVYHLALVLNAVIIIICALHMILHKGYVCTSMTSENLNLQIKSLENLTLYYLVK